MDSLISDLVCIRSKIKPGRRFGFCVAIGCPVWCKPTSAERSLFVVCECDCGEIFAARASNLQSGGTKSCGCGIAHKRKGNVGKHKSLSNRWRAMISRCHDETDDKYRYYGQRGISVCDEWRSDFSRFVEWSLANGYEESLELDRENNNLGYCPENCRWIDKIQNMNNRRSCRVYSAFGESKTISQWARDLRCKVSLAGLTDRLNLGLDPEVAISSTDRLQRMATAFGETKNLTDWSRDERCSVTARAIAIRLNSGIEDQIAITMPSKRQKIGFRNHSL